jgi:hypothetical protein
MRKVSITLLLFFPLYCFAGSGQYNCNIWNYQTGVGTGSEHANGAYHLTGNHSFHSNHNGSCSYGVAPSGGGPCPLYVSAGNVPTGSDTGAVTSLTHVIHFGQYSGSASGLGPLSATAKAAAAVETCFLGVCSFNVSISVQGVTVTVSSGSPIWTAEDTFVASCAYKSYPNNSPIIIDVAGEGFNLTDAANGVTTSMVSGSPLKIAWTQAGSHNAFLWLDDHLFGNFTQQPASDNPNGFAALAVYDTNFDNVIDASDPVFAQLRLWIDSNHDGVSQPQELFTLPSLGVFSIGLRYKETNIADDFGNVFRYRGKLKMAAAGVDRTIYDVFLATNQP